MRLINRCIPNCGSTSTSKCTRSGRISSAITSARYLEAALYQLQKAFGDFSHENFTAIFGTPNDVIFAAVHDMVIGLVSQHHGERCTSSLSFSLSTDNYEPYIHMPEGSGSTAPFGRLRRCHTSCRVSDIVEEPPGSPRDARHRQRRNAPFEK